MITTRELDALFGAVGAASAPLATGAASDVGPTVFWPCDLRDRVPAPVVRYFAQSLLPGAPVVPAVRLRMRGRLRLGRVWLPFRAEEVLAPRQGFRWSATVAGLIRGADTGGAGPGRLHWRLAGLLTLVDAEGPDVARSAAGRCGAEAIWAPAAVLPGPGVAWSALDDRHLRVRFGVGDTPVDLHLHLDEGGHLQAFRTMRWGDPDGTGRWDWHPFGGRVLASRLFGTSVVPASGAVGWYPDRPDARRREFFRFRLTSLTPTSAAA
ncbi:DUF6544 family protein [Actinomycetospora cinnamomea]|uniref:Uncharacterized protein n=1 Tax=Actinomycetospora cinnamomea TaxID=663609 RepID=A0A2U1F3S8_9PSEU|nr:DUF6544 family protein [Actinomycetospora cinnamomea]PVZ06827.1 hypothetical protein C8D89_11220 [Actinomycetospora cinnamomea]